jgi:CO/xanthine dehydrogenase Mo-binding subunit
VRYVGEPVAVVVADDPYRLSDALDAVVVDYDPLPPVMTPERPREARTASRGLADNAAVVVRGRSATRSVPSPPPT